VHGRRFVATALASAVLIAVAAAPALGAPAGGKGIVIEAVGLTGFGAFTVSGGQSVPVQIKISNPTKATVNDVRLLVGQDANPTTAPNGDATPPIALPSGVTASATGCTPGAILSCQLGTLRSGKSVTVNVTVQTDEVATAIPAFLTKATVLVAEGGNDNGSNQDSFSVEGTMSVLAFSCESVTVYKPGADKTVQTCGVTDTRNANGQSATVVIPSKLITATVGESAAACPSVPGLKCIGDVVTASIDGDTTSDVVTWTTSIKVTGSVNTNKLVVYHYNDAGVLTDVIALKNNKCKTASSINCGVAALSGGVLTITVQTGGNGAIRGFG
jgi:hypothetical protein